MMKKTIAMLLALVMMLSLVACGGGSDAKAPANPNSLAVCLASEPDTIDPALNSTVDGATLCAHLFSGLAKWVQDGNKTVIAPDAAVELPEGVVNADGTVTYTYTLQDATWSDGQPVTAGDFEFAWKRAASSDLGSDYGYMFDVVKGYPDNLAVSALDDKTLEVTLNNPVAYWNELLAFPCYFPTREDVVADEAWATEPATYVSNGMYTMTAWSHNSVITLTKNEAHYAADEVTMPEIKFYLSDDANNMLTNFKKGDWQLIDDVPTNEISALKADYPEEFVIAGQIGTYYTCWNINENLLPASSTLTGAEKMAAEAEIRNALTLVLDRTYIADEIAQAGQVPAPSFVAMGMKNPDGTEFYTTSGDSEEFDGYYNVDPAAFNDNFAQCIEILKKYYTFDEATGMFTDMPTLTYLYNTGEGHKAIAEYIQSAFASVGLNLQLENQEWKTFLNTRKDGHFAIARNGWVADFSDPICFLDMWITTSGNNDVQFGKGEHADLAIYDLDLTEFGYNIKVEDGTWAETYDVLIDTIKTCTDNEARYAMMHVAEDMLMETGCIMPLYFYTDIYMVNSALQGFFSNPLGYKFFMYSTLEA